MTYLTMHFAREFVIRKVAASAFLGSPLMGLLNFLRVDTLIVGEESTSGCARASLVDATFFCFVSSWRKCTYDCHDGCRAINLFDTKRKWADVLALSEVLDYSNFFNWKVWRSILKEIYENLDLRISASQYWCDFGFLRRRI